MLLHPAKEIFRLKLRWKSLLVFLLIIISLFWSLEGAVAQYARSVTATKTYNSNGVFTITDLADITGFDPSNEIFAVANVDILIVGGGGGGGAGTSAGGGGGGEVKLINIDLNLGAQIVITIGNGGNGGNGSNRGTNGGNSQVILNSGSFVGNYLARGGGYGGGSGANRDGGSGGSGGGGGVRKTPASQAGSGSAGGTSTGTGGGTSYSNSGGNGSFTTSLLSGGAGGGGAGGVGSPGISSVSIGIGGNGGAGISPIGFSGLYGAGGGGTGTTGNGIGGNGYGANGSGGNAGSAGGSDGSNGIVVVNISYRILPVEFLFFNAIYKPNDRSASLEWETAKEWENSHFEIERAVNTIKDWKTVGRVEGNGYSDGPISYRFNDTDLLAIGGNIFYRIKQVDFNGNYSFSKTKAIQIPFPKESQEAWIAFPNPNVIGSETNIKLVKDYIYNDEIIYLRILNSFGQSNFETVSSPEELTSLVSNWMKNKTSGIYIIDIQWANHSQQIKLFRE